MIRGKYLWATNLIIVLLVSCFAILHQPDGVEVRIDKDHIVSIRPNVQEHTRRQLHQAVEAVVDTGSQKFGVVETENQVQEAIRNCIDGNK
jgi:hypothetical protein